jgi:hypothetical protein
MSIVVPKILELGAGPLAELSYLEDMFGIPHKTAFAYLAALHIQPVFVGAETYFSLRTFQRIMHVLTKPGGPGFAFPGAAPRANDTRLREITPDLLERAMDPITAMEMEVARNPDSLTIQRLLHNQSPSAGKSKPKETLNE